MPPLPLAAAYPCSSASQLPNMCSRRPRRRGSSPTIGAAIEPAKARRQLPSRPRPMLPIRIHPRNAPSLSVSGCHGRGRGAAGTPPTGRRWRPRARLSRHAALEPLWGAMARCRISTAPSQTARDPAATAGIGSRSSFRRTRIATCRAGTSRLSPPAAFGR